MTCNVIWGLVNKGDLSFSLSVELLRTLRTTKNDTEIYRYQKKEANDLHYFFPKIMNECIVFLSFTLGCKVLVKLYFFVIWGAWSLHSNRTVYQKALPHCNNGNCWLFAEVQWSAKHSVHAWIDTSFLLKASIFWRCVRAKGKQSWKPKELVLVNVPVKVRTTVSYRAGPTTWTWSL